MKRAGTTSKAPLAEAFGRWSNLKIVLIALLGAVMGQAVVWYTGQFYALFFLERVAACRRRDHQHFDRHRPRARNARIHFFRLDVGSNRPQADHPRRMSDRRGHVHVAVPRANLLRQSRVGRGAGQGAGDRGRRSGAMLRSVRSRRQEQIRLDLLRYREELPGQGRCLLSARRRATRKRRANRKPARRR